MQTFDPLYTAKNIAEGLNIPLQVASDMINDLSDMVRTKDEFLIQIIPRGDKRVRKTDAVGVLKIARYLRISYPETYGNLPDALPENMPSS